MPRTDQGVNHERYRVIPRTLIFVTRGESVLLIRGAPTKRLWANRYNGIGGHIERGETVLAAARRELDEEAGIQAEALRLVGTLLVDADENTGICLFILRGAYAAGMPAASKEGHPEWVGLAQLEGLPQVEDLNVILPRVLAAKSGDAPFSARSFYDQDERLQVVFDEVD